MVFLLAIYTYKCHFLVKFVFVGFQAKIQTFLKLSIVPAKNMKLLHDIVVYGRGKVFNALWFAFSLISYLLIILAVVSKRSKVVAEFL